MASLDIGPEAAQRTPGSKVVEEMTNCEYDVTLFFGKVSEFKKSPNERSYPSTIGRLKAHGSFWRQIGAPQFILNVVCSGYVIPFLNEPPGSFSDNNRSALDHVDFVTDAISELVRLGTAVQVDDRPYIVNPLSVSVQSDGKERLILDLSFVNLYLRKFKIKFEDGKIVGPLTVKQIGILYIYGRLGGNEHYKEDG